MDDNEFEIIEDNINNENDLDIDESIDENDNDYEIVEIINPDKLIFLDISSILMNFGFQKNNIIQTIKTKQFNLLNDIFNLLEDHRMILLKYKNEQWFITNFYINQELKYRYINFISFSNNFNDIITEELNNNKLELEDILNKQFQSTIHHATFIQTYFDNQDISRSCFIFN